MTKNFWLNHKGKKKITQNINSLLKKFVGRDVDPIKETFDAMRKVVVKYFKKNPDDAKFFSDDELFDYGFEIEENNGIITKVDFQTDSY
jgi:predicted glycosyltransferase involved in capsule biosynthesis